MGDLNSSGEYRLFLGDTTILLIVFIFHHSWNIRSVIPAPPLLLMSLPDSNHFSVVIKMNYEVHFNELKVMEMSYFFKKKILLLLSFPVLDVNDLCHKWIKWENAHRESKYTALIVLYDLIEIFLWWKLFWISRNDLKNLAMTMNSDI